MLDLVVTVLIVFIVLVLNEIWWRKHELRGEFSRKFIHIAVGSYVAIWPLYLNWNEIRLLGLAFLVVVLLSKYLKVFQAIHNVQRPTWGELYFALSVASVTFVTHNKWIYAAAILQMAIADGLAAIIGLRYGKKQSYRLFAHTKSVVGTLTFLISSLVILLIINKIGNLSTSIALLVVASLLATILENLAALGLDNLLVPLIVALLLAHH